MKPKKIIIIIIISFLLAALIGWIVYDNSQIIVTEYTITDSEIPASFSGYRIVQISDLHNTEFGSKNVTLLTKIQELQPDIIILTGDLIDSYHTNVDISLYFAEQAVQIAPTYYVTGNHEVRIPGEYQKLKNGMETAGVTILDSSIPLSKGDNTVYLLGIPDPSHSGPEVEQYTQICRDHISRIVSDDMGFTILLSHRPEVFDVYVETGIDLVFTGHTHGGQIQIPFLGALYAPNQGLFPKYAAGLFTEQETTMVVCQGLGNSSFPFRINCPPEIVAVTLMHK